MTVSCFLTGSSGARIGDRSPSVPSPAGVQRAWSHPIGMYTKPRRRTGLAGVLAWAVAAGIIASSSGSARVAWRPFRNVRLGSAFLLIIIMKISSFEGYAFHDSQYERREAVSIR